MELYLNKEIVTKFKVAALPLMLLAATVAAEEYTSISTAAYSQIGIGIVDEDQYRIDSIYYFVPKNTLGPLNEFEYINKASNIFGAYSKTDYGPVDFDYTTIGGEYFAANNFVVGGAFRNAENFDTYSATVGYLFSPNFQLTVEATKVETDNTDVDYDPEFTVDARYNYQLNGTDYIGFDFSTDDELDTRTLSSKYFKDLGGETYLAVNAAYFSLDEANDFWTVGANCYFRKLTSVGFDYDDDEKYTFGVSHFFSNNVAGIFAYSATNDDYDLDQYLLGITVQL